jgi:PKD repeat protein
MRITSRIWLIAALAVTVACTVKDVTAPPLAGPSELGLRLAMTAIPDSILQDGASQTTITIEATGADNRPVRGLAIRLEMAVNGEFQDFGTLSSKSVVTGDDGKARVTYTAPPRPAEPVDLGTIITIFATPSGNDFRGAYARQIDIRLVTPGVILPPNSGPVADFTFSPSSPAAGSTVTFDASTTTDEGVQCGTRCTYAWDFGDGTTGSGIFTTHQYRVVGSYQVKMTATDNRGASATIAKTLDVAAGTAPTAAFTFSPSNPAVNQRIFFNAEGTKAGPGRTIISYRWDFGNGRADEGVTTSTSYGAPGTYTVTLTATDDIGQTGTTTQAITVGVTPLARSPN